LFAPFGGAVMDFSRFNGDTSGGYLVLTAGRMVV